MYVTLQDPFGKSHACLKAEKVKRKIPIGGKSHKHWDKVVAVQARKWVVVINRRA